MPPTLGIFAAHSQQVVRYNLWLRFDLFQQWLCMYKRMRRPHTEHRENPCSFTGDVGAQTAAQEYTATTVAGNVPISILYNSLPQRAMLARVCTCLFLWPIHSVQATRGWSPQSSILTHRSCSRWLAIVSLYASMISLLRNLRTMYIMQAPRQLNTFMYYRYKCSRWMRKRCSR